MGSVSQSICLDTIVVGGGIGGLSAAIALRRAGHRVTVYEKYSANADAGAGIVVCANAGRVLKQWGLDLESAGMLKMVAGHIVDGKTLDVLSIMYGKGSTINREEDNGEAQYMATRRDLRHMLRDEVERTQPGQGSIDVRYGVQVVEYDAERSAIKFADGSWQEADLIVACDGIKSRAATVICGGENPPSATGFSAFRMLIPTTRLEGVRKKFEAVPAIREKFDPELGRVWFAREYRRLVVWWACRFTQIQAFDIIIPDNDKYAGSEEWLATCDKQVLLDEFGHWHPLFRELLKVADNPQLWKISSREPLELLFRGRLCMLGDALHPMPPFRAQGGSQSIEDAGALEMCFSNVKDKSELPNRLQLLNDLRVPRFSSAQLISAVRQDEPNMDERYLQVLDTCRKWFRGQDQWHLESRANFTTWLLSYDVRAAARQAVAEAGYASATVSLA